MKKIIASVLLLISLILAGAAALANTVKMAECCKAGTNCCTYKCCK